MSEYEYQLWLIGQWEQATRDRNEARLVATIVREEVRCDSFDEDCARCKANKLVDQWEDELGAK